MTSLAHQLKIILKPVIEQISWGQLESGGFGWSLSLYHNQDKHQSNGDEKLKTEVLHQFLESEREESEGEQQLRERKEKGEKGKMYSWDAV